MISNMTSDVCKLCGLEQSHRSVRELLLGAGAV